MQKTLLPAPLQPVPALILFVNISATSLSLSPSYSSITAVLTGLLAFLLVLGKPLHKLPLTHFFRCSLLWFFWTLTSFLLAQRPDLALTQTISLAKILLMVLFLQAALLDTRSFTLAFFGLSLGGLLTASYVLLFGRITLQEGLSAAGEAFRLTTSQNTFATTLFIAAAAALILFYQKTALPLRLYSAFTLVFLTGAQFYTGSRQGALLTFLLCYGLMHGFRRRSKLFARLLRLLGVVLLFAISWSFLAQFFAQSEVFEKTLRLFEGNPYQGDQYRYQYYVEGLHIVGQHPIFGIGLDNFRVHSTLGGYSHSHYLEVFASTGIVGGLILFTGYFHIIRRTHRLWITTRHLDYAPHGAFLFVILALALGAVFRPYILDKSVWALLSVLSAYISTLPAVTRAALPASSQPKRPVTHRPGHSPWPLRYTNAFYESQSRPTTQK